MLRALMNKVDSVWEQVGSGSREMGLLKNQKEMLVIKPCHRKEECF